MNHEQERSMLQSLARDLISFASVCTLVASVALWAPTV